MTDRSVARELARRSVDSGDPVGWFEELYRLAETSPEVLPWSDMRANSKLVTWTEDNNISGPGRRALVVGCGYGDDAEWLASLGFEVLAFDISPTAISVARRRFPDSLVDYRVADVLNLPDEWRRAFDLVFEAYTLQVLPGEPRAVAARQIAATVKDALIIVARGRDEDDDPGTMPWPLTWRDLLPVCQSRPDLVEVSFEEYVDDEIPPVRRFMVEYRPI
jgi:2-polyprenyl-3-methyl-5-hydroxy-6-metoxy-1,4-benzoquinol methylase